MILKQPQAMRMLMMGFKERKNADKLLFVFMILIVDNK